MWLAVLKTSVVLGSVVTVRNGDMGKQLVVTVREGQRLQYYRMYLSPQLRYSTYRYIRGYQS